MQQPNNPVVDLTNVDKTLKPYFVWASVIRKAQTDQEKEELKAKRIGPLFRTETNPKLKARYEALMSL